MRWIERLEEGLLALLLAMMVAITFMQVIARYVFNYSFVWALEVTTVFFAWLIFLGMSYGMRVGSHIGVDVLVRGMGSRAARVVSMIAAGLCVVYALIVAIGGYQYVHKMYEVGILMQDVEIEQWIPRLVLPIGYALLAFRAGEVLLRLARGKEAHLLGDEAKEALKLRADEPGEGGEKK